MSARPDSGPPREYRFPRFDRLASGNGELISAHLPGRPLATLTLVLPLAGAVNEPSGQEGLALLTGRMLAEGTTRRDGYEFAVTAERLGASWQADAAYDSLQVGFDVPAENLPGAVELLAEAVRMPAFDSSAFHRIRAERIDELTLEESQPAAAAARAFAASLWAPQSRYRTRVGGERDSVSQIGLADVVGFAAGRLHPARATLIVAGDLAGLDPRALAEAFFAGWVPGTPLAPDPADPAQPTGGSRRAVLVDRPGAVQSMLYVGHPGPARRCADYVALTTFGFALGGMFNSRLNLRLREELGYTYGAQAGFELRRHGGIFAAAAAVERSVTGPALAEILEVLQEAHDHGLGSTELAVAQSYRSGVFPVNFNGPAALARALADIVVHELPDDYYDRLRAEVTELDLAAVNAAAADRLHPEALVSVVVGDAARIELDPACGSVSSSAG